MKLSLIYEDMHDDFMDVYGPPLTGDMEAEWWPKDEAEDEIDPADQEAVEQYFAELEMLGEPQPSEEELINMAKDDIEPTLKRQADIRKKWYEGGYSSL